MSLVDRYLWRVYCTTGGVYETIVSDTEPTVCPSDGFAIDSNLTVILESVFEDIFTEGYINIESSLADNQAVKICASDTNGGINIDAGFGGITVDTTNTISLDAAAASNFTTTVGNLELEATNAGSGALINIDADSGINIGSDASANATNTPIVNIGTSAAAKTITVGNVTSTTQLALKAGTGGYHVDVADGGTISLDTTGASCNFTINTNSAAQDLNLAVLGSTDSSIILTSQGTGSDAIKLDTTGGLDVDAVGGVDIATSGASSVIFTGGSGGVIMNTSGGSGPIGIGNWTGGDLFIGNAAVARTLTIGNNTGATTITLTSGTGGTALSSTGQQSITSTSSAADAIRLNSTGGIDVDAADTINITTTDTDTDAIRLLSSGGLDFDASGNIDIATSGSSSFVMTAGSGGMIMNTSGGSGPIGIGSWTGGDIYIGTAAAARTIYIGNTTTTTAVNLNSGTGGIAIGNDSNGGEIQIGDVANAKTITIGNSTGASQLFTRFGTGGHIKHQETATALADSNASLSASSLLASVLTGTPTADRTLTLPDAADVVTAITGVEVGDCFDFSIINKSSSSDEADFILSAGTGGTIDGNGTISSNANNAGTYESSGSGLFRLLLTNVTASSEAYTLYRIG